jgi:hypothetical protein
MSKMLSVSVVALALLWLAGPVMAADIGKGNILVEEWFTADTGQQVNNDVTTLHNYINAGHPPDTGFWAQSTDASQPDAVDYWGGRMRGYLYPTQTGDYTFWTCSDDDSEVWLSTDDNPANVQMICNVEGWMPSGAWDGAGGDPGTNFKSGTVKLEAGKKYYVETYWADGTGGGYQTVGWGGPGIGTGPVIIAGKYLSPWLRDPEPYLYARDPIPPDGGINEVGQISWTKGAASAKRNVYLGTTRELTDADRVLTNKTSASYYAGDLEPGATYYWRVDEIDKDNNVFPGPVWSFMMAPLSAYSPTPANGVKYIDPNVTLTWKPGQNAFDHELYFSTNKAAVEGRDAAALQTSTDIDDFQTFTPGPLTLGTTYYWAVDETDLDEIKTPGDVWSFTVLSAMDGALGEYFLGTTPGGVPILVRADPAIDFEWGDGSPGGTVPVDDFSVRWTADLKVDVPGTYTFIGRADDGIRVWLNGEQIIDGWVEQGATDYSSPAIQLGRSVYALVMEYFERGGGAVAHLDWKRAGMARTPIPISALGMPGRLAQLVYPQGGDANVPQNVILSWKAATKAVKHAVYFGTDKAAVENATLDAAVLLNKDVLTFDPGQLDANTTYYWRVDEVNTADTTSPWQGAVADFTTASCLIVDNFETYSGDNAVFDTWLDNYDTTATVQKGAIVGFDAEPYIETRAANVHGGRQSMPLSYDNTGPKYLYSQTVRDVDVADWASNGTELSLWVKGRPPAFMETATGVKMSASGADIVGQTDEFRYAYKPLTGDGSITVRVDRLDITSGWCKAGVMIRSSLDPVVPQVDMIISGTNGFEFQWRLAANTDTSSVNTYAYVQPTPQWVRLIRKGNTFTGESSPDGVTWSKIVTTDTPPATSVIDVPMTGTVYIGLVLTATAAGSTTVGEFSNITVEGATGAWQVKAIAGDHNVSNDLAPFYVILEDSTSKKSPPVSNPTLVSAENWTQWKIPLSSFTGISLSKVKKIYLGVGNPQNPAVGGSGDLWIDDIRVTKP